MATEWSERQKQDYFLLADTAVLAGEIMLKSGAETHRVEDTIYRILKLSNFERCEVLVVTAGIVVTLEDWRIDTISMLRRVGDKTTNLGNITEVNDISRKLCSGEISLKQAFHLLKHMESRRISGYLDLWVHDRCGGRFYDRFGRHFFESVFAALNGIYLVLSMLFNKRYKVNIFVTNMAVSFLMAFTTRGFSVIPGVQMEIERVIAGSVMMLLPGVAITNAIRDTLHSDYMAGSAKIVEAFAIAASVGVGIGAGLAIGTMVFGG